MLYYPWRDKATLCGSEHSYASKFYDPGVQAVVQRNRAIFKPDAEAVTEALALLRNNEGNIIHSFDCMNDQENGDIELLETEEEIVEESFNQELPSHLLQDSVSNRETCPALLTNQNVPAEVSDDQFRESVRCLNISQ